MIEDILPGGDGARTHVNTFFCLFTTADKK